MKLGIIILTWNSGTSIKKCLNSLNEYSKGHNIYVVDNNSKDSTVQFIKNNYPKVKIVQSPSNLGFASGNNLGISVAKKDGCEYFLLINDDTYLIEDFITPCICQLDSNPKIGVLGPIVVEHYNHNIIQSGGGKINLFTLDMPYLDKGKKFVCKKSLRNVDYVLGAALFIRANIIQNIEHVLDPEFFPAYVEEVDFCFRIREKGYEVKVNEEVKIVHVGGQSGGNTYIQYRRTLINKILFAIKHLSFIRSYLAIQILLVKYILFILRKQNNYK